MAHWVISLFRDHCGVTRGFKPGIPACELGVYSHYDTGAALGQDIVDHQKKIKT